MSHDDFLAWRDLIRIERSNMTPEQVLGKSKTEGSHQAAFFCWLHQNKHLQPGFEFAYSVPNGGKRNPREAADLVRTGVKRGVPDVCIPIPCGQYHGLYIEFKKPALEKSMKGTVTDPDQIRYRDYLISQNYSHFVAFHYLQAVEFTINYLS
jgi:hypothetical protein